MKNRQKPTPNQDLISKSQLLRRDVAYLYLAIVQLKKLRAVTVNQLIRPITSKIRMLNRELAELSKLK